MKMSNKKLQITLEEYITHLKLIGCSEEEIEFIRQKHINQANSKLRKELKGVLNE